MNLGLFTNFQSGLASPCPKRKTPKVMAYPKQKCGATVVDAGTISLNYEDGPCMEIVLEVNGGSVSAGGQSASFACV